MSNPIERTPDNAQAYSVLMTVYYKEKPEYFEQSIRSMLYQTVRPDEFVIVCDGALTPELDAVIAYYSDAWPGMFRIIRLSENCGSGAASREGMLACRNELVARMDADDISAYNRMELLLEAFRKEPELCAVGGQLAEFIDHPDRVISYRILPTEPEDVYKCMALRSPINNITVLLRKSAVLAVGNYSQLRAREDNELWIRLLGNGYRMRNIDKVLSYARVGEDMYSRRRGMEYFRQTVYTEKTLLKYGFISPVRYAAELCARFAASVVLPEKFSYRLFCLLMRKKNYTEGDALLPEAKPTYVIDEVFAGPFTRAAAQEKPET